MEIEGITVITLTRGRSHLLTRAINTVQKQVCRVPVQHLILVDACNETREYLGTKSDLPPNLQWIYIERSDLNAPIAGRLAYLRNTGVHLARTHWIAFLDDDNELQPNHLDTLLECAYSTGFAAVHSERALFYQDGSPFLGDWIPWCADEAEARSDYDWLRDKGVMTPGSNIMKDRVEASDVPYAVQIVDIGEWLVYRRLLLEIPFRTEYDDMDRIHGMTEDSKFLMDLIRRSEPIACTSQATLVYYLGGFTNTIGKRNWTLMDDTK